MTELNEQGPYGGQMNCRQCGRTISPQEKFYRDFDGCNYHLGWGANKKITLKPSKGLTVITGPNGSGKTTLTQALEWVLFGKTSHTWIRVNSGDKMQ